MSNKRKVFVLCILVALAHGAGAQRADVYIPDELRLWQDWVLHGKEYRNCPFFFNRDANSEADFVCAWPGQLDLAVDATGGRFSQAWTVYATNAWVPLPGDRTVWPRRVSADGRSIPVVDRREGPSVWLAPGRYVISGRFEWSERPRTLTIPAQSGLLDLSVDGSRVSRPDRSGGSVWLGEREQATRLEDSLQVQVYRQIADDIPSRLSTIFEIEISGSVREEQIGPALPEGFTPLAIESELPTRLEPDGNIRLQVRPGSWQIRLLARAATVLNEVTLSPPALNLPANEIWSYLANQELRVTAPEGLTPIDPGQVGVPPGWEELPGFRIEAGESLTIVERSRGKVATDNQLSLNRQLWLDFDGGGFVFGDTIGGQMRSGWRLDMSGPYAVHSAAESGENLLVTVGAEQGFTGIEVRQPDLDLSIIGRVESRAGMPVSGWQARFDNVDTILHLPPGNKLLAAIGADRSPTSWVDRWKLLDFFLVLIVSVSAARLFGRAAGVLSLVALTLCAHEPGAPAFVWLSLLIAIALVRVAPAGRLLQLSKTYRTLSFVALLVIFVPFAAGQLRIAMYPSLEPQGYQPVSGVAGIARRDQAPGTQMVMAPASEQFADALESREVPARDAPLAEIVVSANKFSSSFSRYAPNAIVQVGPGRPAWRWNSYRLSWSGPVDPEHGMRLLIMPRWLVTLLRFVEVLLLGALVAVFAFEILGRKPPWAADVSRDGGTSASLAAIVSVGLVATGLCAIPVSARADTPSDAILKQLEQRLLAPPSCAPRCAEIVDAVVTVAGDEMTIQLTANALDNAAVSLPGSEQGWRAERVLIDGAPADQLYRSPDQALWVRTPEGQRVITLSGPLPPVDSLEVPFPTTPRVIRVDAPDWFVAGIRDQRLLSGSLQLTRLRQASADGDGTARWESSRFPVFVRVERNINLDLDWRVATTVYRVAPQQGALAISVPVLEGESVTTEDLTVSDGEVQVSMNPRQQFVSWESTLPRQSPLILQAREDVASKDVWSISIGSIWHTASAGVPESEYASTGASFRVARFYPRPGESLELEVDRPEATSGDTMVFDRAENSTEVGDRSRVSTLTLSYRSTRGAQHSIGMPPDSEISSVVIDGQVAPLRAVNNELRLPILPGEHTVTIQWRNSGTVSFRERTPAVDLGAGASNVHLSLTLPPNRWVLGTFGPKLGPSVLYWSELVALILIAFVLGRLQLAPLRTRHWLLLGLGFSTFNWYALALVVVWLLASGAQRGWKRDLSRWRYNGTQAALALLSLAALATIVVSLPMGLLGSPDMHVVGNNSYGNYLRWFDDRSVSDLPSAYVLSLPIWVYKALILGWALWLSFALLRWLPWVWQQFIADGLWRARERPAATAGDTS